MYELVYEEYPLPFPEPYKGFYTINGECVGFLTMDDKFFSIARAYGIDIVNERPGHAPETETEAS